MTRRNIPRYRFSIQRSHAKRRGIEWQMTFEEWFAVWQESGHWHERGNRVGQYVMARHGDTGPYSPDNVSIVTCSQNISEAKRKDDLPMGVSRVKSWFKARRHLNGKCTYLGCFSTPEEAHEAYLRAA